MITKTSTTDEKNIVESLKKFSTPTYNKISVLKKKSKYLIISLFFSFSWIYELSKNNYDKKCLPLCAIIWLGTKTSVSILGDELEATGNQKNWEEND